MKKALIPLAAAAIGSMSGAAHALSTQIAGVDVQFDNKLSVGAAWRVESRDLTYIGRGNGGRAFSTNGDDGNLAFDNGDIVSAAAKITSDLTLSKGNFGVFVRGSYVYNQKLDDYDYFNPNNYYTPTPGAPDVGVGLTPTGRPSEVPISVFDERTEAVRDYVGNYFDLLDAYVFGNFDIGNRMLAFRIGRQVLNWGESTFVLHGINSMLTFDQNRQRVPGFEIEELLLPTAVAWVSMSLFSGASVEAFYQLDWDKTEIDAAGTFWSVNDFATIGGQRANLTFGLPPENFPNTTIPRAPNREPGNSGQFGVRLTFLVPALNDMDLSLYAMNYHSRLPLVSGTSKASFAAPASTGSYFLEYPEDIQLYGISFNTVLGGWSVQGEYSYKVDQPLQLEDVEVLLAGVGLPSQLTADPAFGGALGGKYLRGYRRHDVSQVDFGVTYAIGPSALTGWDQLLFIGEVAGVYVHDLPPQSVLRYEGPGTYTPGDASVAALVSASTLPALGSAVPQETDGWATAISWGYKMVARAQYNNVFGSLRVEPTLRFDHDIRGVTPTPITNFIEDRRQISASVATFYLQSWSVEAGYTRYFGGGRHNLFNDRDFVSAVIKYAF
jgi:hypothetical protein